MSAPSENRIAFSTTGLGWGTTLPAAIRFAAENGFRGVEVMADEPPLHPDLLPHTARREARKLAAEAKIPLSLHAPFSLNDIASHLPGQRRESLRELLASIELAADLGAEVVVVHPGRLAPAPPSQFPSAHPLARAEARSYALDSLGRAASRAGSLGVRLALENLGMGWTDLARRTEDVVGLAREVGSPWVGVCFDGGHAHLAETVEGALAAVPGELLFHWHIHDNRGKGDDHLELGRGNVPWAACAPRMRSSPALLSFEVLGEEGDLAGALLRSQEWLERLLRGEGGGA